jgi:transcriptional regulator with XRE-family HTH domain
MKLGVSATHLNQVMNGRARPGSDLVQRMVKLLGRSNPRPFPECKTGGGDNNSFSAPCGEDLVTHR